MNFIIYFFIVIIGYLSIAKTTYDHSSSIEKISDIAKLENTRLTPPATIVLLSIKTHGTFIKSHYLRLKLIGAFHTSKDFYVRVPRMLVDHYANYIGMSIYNISNQSSDFNNDIITLPGLYFVGNPQLGRWIYLDGEEKWSFYKVYQHLPNDLGWENFVPTLKDYKEYINRNKKTDSYISYEHLFGPNGQLTKKFILKHIKEHKNNDGLSIELLKSYFHI